MIDKQELISVINASLEGTGKVLVRVSVSGDNVIDVELDSLDGITLDDCIAVDRAVHEAFSQDTEDYELTVGSYSLSEPFVLPLHYHKNMGEQVEVLTADGRKLKGTLTAAGDDGFTVTIPTKTKIEGKKRPEILDVEHNFKYNEIKYTKNIF